MCYHNALCVFVAVYGHGYWWNVRESRVFNMGDGATSPCPQGQRPKALQTRVSNMGAREHRVFQHGTNL